MSDLLNGPSRPSLTIGGRVFTDIKNLKRLVAYSAGANNCTFRESGVASTAGYTPSGSNKFRVLALEIWSYQTAALGETPNLLSADNDVGVNTSNAFTNAVYPCGDSALQAVPWLVLPIGKYEVPYDYLLPNGKYLGLDNSTANARVAMVAWGYEEA